MQFSKTYLNNTQGRFVVINIPVYIVIEKDQFSDSGTMV
jgi:hypothetical protein